MTPKQADRIIAQGQPVTVHNTAYNETFTATFVRRDRRMMDTAEGGRFHRDELELVTNPQ